MGKTAVIVFVTYLMLSCTLTPLLQVLGDDPYKYEGLYQNNDYYTLNSYEVGENDKCVKHVFVIGKGIRDSFEIACSSKGVTSFNSMRLMVYHNPADSFSLYSDIQGRLDIVNAGNCKRREYEQERYTLSELTDYVCNEVQLKIKRAIDEYKIILGGKFLQI